MTNITHTAVSDVLFLQSKQLKQTNKGKEMSKDTYTFEDCAVRNEIHRDLQSLYFDLYDDLKSLYRKAISVKDGGMCVEIEDAVEKCCGFARADFLNDMKYEDKAKERASNSEIDADKFLADHFVFTTVKM